MLVSSRILNTAHVRIVKSMPPYDDLPILLLRREGVRRDDEQTGHLLVICH
jgi:hypothetical protein